MQTPCPSQMRTLKRSPGLQDSAHAAQVPQLWYANHLWAAQGGTHNWRMHHQPVPRQTKSDQNSLTKACILNRDLKGIKIICLIWERCLYYFLCSLQTDMIKNVIYCNHDPISLCLSTKYTRSKALLAMKQLHIILPSWRHIFSLAKFHQL